MSSSPACGLRPARPRRAEAAARDGGPAGEPGRGPRPPGGRTVLQPEPHLAGEWSRSTPRRGPRRSPACRARWRRRPRARTTPRLENGRFSTPSRRWSRPARFPTPSGWCPRSNTCLRRHGSAACWARSIWRRGASMEAERGWSRPGTGAGGRTHPGRRCCGRPRSSAELALVTARIEEAIVWVDGRSGSRNTTPASAATDSGCARSSSGWPVARRRGWTVSPSCRRRRQAPIADSDALVARGMARLAAEDLEAAIADLATAKAREEAGVRLRLASQCLTILADAEYRFGDWDSADLHAGLAVSIAEDSGRFWTSRSSTASRPSSPPVGASGSWRGAT